MKDMKGEEIGLMAADRRSPFRLKMVEAWAGGPIRLVHLVQGSCSGGL
jgi:hypothetical protein